MIDSAALLGTPASHSRIGGTIRPSSNTLVAWLGIEPGDRAADVVVVAEGLHERHDLALALNTGTVTQRSGRWPIPPSER